MKSGDMSKTTAITVACLSLAMYAMAQKAGAPGGGRGGPAAGTQNQPVSVQHQNQRMQSQQSSATASMTPVHSPTPGFSPTGTSHAQAKVKTSLTPRGHHYGWQQG